MTNNNWFSEKSKKEFLNKYSYLDGLGHSKNNNEIKENKTLENNLYIKLFNCYVQSIIDDYIKKGYKEENIIFNSFSKEDNKIILYFEGIEEKYISI